MFFLAACGKIKCESVYFLQAFYADIFKRMCHCLQPEVPQHQIFKKKNVSVFVNMTAFLALQYFIFILNSCTNWKCTQKQGDGMKMLCFSNLKTFFPNA